MKYARSLSGQEQFSRNNLEPWGFPGPVVGSNLVEVYDIHVL
jgi:hypothetical protein